MLLVCYHEEQNALRLFMCGTRCWEDMYEIWFNTRERTDLNMLMEYGWEVIGEL